MAESPKFHASCGHPADERSTFSRSHAQEGETMAFELTVDVEKSGTRS